MKKKARAFTLVETLVAITIMTLAILAPFQAVERVISESRLAGDQLVAASLAQEGLEYVRFIRYNNYLHYIGSHSDNNYEGDILDGLAASPTDCVNHKCTVDAEVAPSAAIAECGSVCPALDMDSTNGFYTQQTGSNYPATIFTRSIQVTRYSGYEQATVIITWTDHGSQAMTITEDFYDWF